MPIQEARHKPGPWLEGRSSVKIVAQRRNRRQTSGFELDKHFHRKRRLRRNHDEIWQQTAPAGGAHAQLTAHLLIDSLSSEDNGLYLCRVDFKKARSRTQESVLKIIG